MPVISENGGDKGGGSKFKASLGKLVRPPAIWQDLVSVKNKMDWGCRSVAKTPNQNKRLPVPRKKVCFSAIYKWQKS